MTLSIISATISMALREIRRNAMRSSLTVLGIVIGVASVIALVTLGEGATLKVTADVSSMGVNMLTITPDSSRSGSATQRAKSLTMEDARAIARESKAVAAVAPTVSRSLSVFSGNKNVTTQVTGTTPEYFAIRTVALYHGRTFSSAELAGSSCAAVLGAKVWRSLYGSQEALGSTIRLGRVPCRIVGVAAAKGQSSFGVDQDDFVLIPISAFHRRIAGNYDVDGIAVSAVDEDHTGSAKKHIVQLMRERRRIVVADQDDFAVHDTRELIATLQTITGVLTALLGAVAAVSLLVGGIGIMNVMLVSVTERTKEVGLRMAIGATGPEVMLQFLLEAVALCLIGGLVGMVLGLGGGYLADRALDLPFRFLPRVVLISVAFSGCIGVGFGFFPARRAARLDPIEALRHE